MTSDVTKFAVNFGCVNFDLQSARVERRLVAAAGDWRGKGADRVVAHRDVVEGAELRRGQLLADIGLAADLLVAVCDASLCVHRSF